MTLGNKSPMAEYTSSLFARISQSEEALSAMSSEADLTRSPDNMYLTGTQRTLAASNDCEVVFGSVSMLLPGLNWYKVILDGGRGEITACKAESSSLQPFGASPGDPLPPDSRVIVVRHPAAATGVILGTWPTVDVSNSQVYADVIGMGTCTGWKKEQSYLAAASATETNGELQSYSSNRPDDQTTQDWSRISATGVGIHVDDCQAFLRANETAGLFASYYDSYVRLAAANHDFWSHSLDKTIRNDEGELLETEEHYMYPWEAMGAYAAGTTVTKENAADTCQFKEPVARQEPLHDDQEPFARVRVEHGYAGQGGRRTVCTPPAESGIRQRGDTADKDVGVFEEFIAADGSYHLRSAKSLVFAKRPSIAVPRRKLNPEATTGDSAEDGNYKFSNQFGDGPEHKVTAPKLQAGDNSSLQQLCALQDVFSHGFNWKNLHAQHYHSQDFDTPGEADLKFNSNSTELNFDQLASGKSHMAPAQTTETHVDSRYGDVKYFKNCSYLAFPDDGGIVLGDGHGGELVLSGGNLYLNCPGDVWINPGRNVNLWAGDDVNVRARKSVDIVASEADVRLKAEKNMQLLAGNSGTGGVLIESKGTGSNDFENKVGEDVISSGIVLRAMQSAVATAAKDLYLRSGNEAGNPGNIFLDAGKGLGSIIATSKNFLRFTESVQDCFGSFTDDTFTTESVNLFGKSSATIGTPLDVEGAMAIHGSVAIKGSVGIDTGGRGGVVVYNGHFASTVGGLVGKVEPDDELSNQLEEITTKVATSKEELDTVFQSALTDGMYANNQPGDSELRKAAEFTFRDDDSQEQYNIDDTWRLLAPRWQRMLATGEATGGTNWKEQPVKAGNRELYPYPGRKKLTGADGMLWVDSFKLYDPATGAANALGADFEEPTLTELAEVSINDEYKSISN